MCFFLFICFSFLPTTQVKVFFPRRASGEIRMPSGHTHTHTHIRNRLRLRKQLKKRFIESKNATTKTQTHRSTLRTARRTTTATATRRRGGASFLFFRRDGHTQQQEPEKDQHDHEKKKDQSGERMARWPMAAGDCGRRRSLRHHRWSPTVGETLERPTAEEKAT